ncbi:MAG: hypothetical protein P8P56_07980 [Yoonia sp.]|nr:hypothetical protein [Yoonia sp.]MDG1861952.1 hypothetical protein [Yoonia sp.]
MSKTKILLLILAFVAITFGSFIWMIATWDADKEKSISYNWTQEGAII